MSKDNGGPAFARPYGGHPDPAMNDPEMQAQDGMSLRDYFAAGFAAAQATATSADTGFIVPDYIYPDGEESVAQKIARISYVMADAMLAARSA